MHLNRRYARIYDTEKLLDLNPVAKKIIFEDINEYYIENYLRKQGLEYELFLLELEKEELILLQQRGVNMDRLFIDYLNITEVQNALNLITQGKTTELDKEAFLQYFLSWLGVVTKTGAVFLSSVNKEIIEYTLSKLEENK